MRLNAPKPKVKRLQQCVICGGEFHANYRRPYCGRKCMALGLAARAAHEREAVAASGVKQCAACECEMPIRFFSASKASGDGHDSYCKACRRVRSVAGSLPVRLKRENRLHVPAGALGRLRDPMQREIAERYWAPWLQAA